MVMTSQLSENSHQGFDGIKAGLCLGSTRVNSNTAVGMPVCLWRNGIRSRSTGKERDAETGLDWFSSRYLSSAQGRFTSPDSPAFASLQYPQAWNLYAYVLNNPLKFNDPSGHAVECKEGDTSKCLADLQASVGNEEAASRLYIDKKIEKAGFFRRLFGQKTITRTFIGINGDVDSFRQLGQNASRMADMVTDERVFGYNVSTTWKGTATDLFGTINSSGRRQLYGGGQTVAPSMGYEPEVFVDPNPATYFIDKDSMYAHIPAANQGEKAAHEFLGHLWGEMIAGRLIGSGANKQDSLDAENAVRNTDPERGQKMQHH
jgi:RHS repeat-associated protein